METVNQFSVDVAPALILMDVQGVKHPVASADYAEDALISADLMQSVGGAGRTRDLMCGDEPDMEPFLLYYTSDRGKPKKAEIARAARIIARSEVTLIDAEGIYGDQDLRVTGNRAIVYPERPGAVTGAVPFLISKSVWFNRNRATVGFPHVDDGYAEELDMVIADINARLMEGSVSAPRP